MKIEQIEKLWLEDCSIDRTDLGAEALKIPSLHQKWYQIYMQEKLLLSQLKAKIEETELLLEGFFMKTLTVEELHENNLTYSDKKYLKPDLPKHISTHSKMVELKLKLAVQTEKCEFLKDIIKTIHGRSFIIKDAIQWAIFSAGGNY